MYPDLSAVPEAWTPPVIRNPEYPSRAVVLLPSYPSQEHIGPDTNRLQSTPISHSIKLCVSGNMSRCLQRGYYDEIKPLK